MLAKQEKALALLVCPRSGKRLRQYEDRISTEDGTHSYPFAGELPILIDFESSVFNEGDFLLRSELDIRTLSFPGKIYRSIRSRIFPPKKSTILNVEYLCDHLLKETGVTRLLVVGGGTIGGGMEPIYDSDRIEVYAFDVFKSSKVHFIADAHQLPLESNKFDAVVIQAVLEHVIDPQQVVDEIWRVLKDDGLVYAETPFMQQVHEGAADFTRFTESGHRFLFRRFESLRSGANGGPGIALRWSIQYFFAGLLRNRKAGVAAGMLVFWLDYLDRLIPERFSIDGASGVYFIGRKSNNTFSVKEVIPYYQGAG